LGNNNWQGKFIHQFSSSMFDCNALLCKFSTTRWGTDDLTMPSLATKGNEIRHFFEGFNIFDLIFHFAATYIYIYII
jgi:hypothetical protein